MSVAAKLSVKALSDIPAELRDELLFDYRGRVATESLAQAVYLPTILYDMRKDFLEQKLLSQGQRVVGWAKKPDALTGLPMILLTAEAMRSKETWKEMENSEIDALLRISNDTTGHMTGIRIDSGAVALAANEAIGLASLRLNLDRHGNINAVGVNLGENIALLGQAVLDQLKAGGHTLSGEEPLERSFRGFDANFNLGQQTGWAVSIGEHTLQIGQSKITFDYILELDNSGKLVREFGVSLGKEQIKIKPDHSLVIVSPELLGGKKGAAYLVKEKDDNFVADDSMFKSGKVSESEDIDFNRQLPNTAWAAEINRIIAEVKSKLPADKLRLFAPTDLVCKIINDLKPNGELRRYSIQLFGDRDTPYITISQHGLFDLEIEYEGQVYSLRYALNGAPGWQLTKPVGVSLQKSLAENLVLDLFTRNAFIELRDEKNKYLTGYKHLNRGDLSVFALQLPELLAGIKQVGALWPVAWEEVFLYREGKYTARLLHVLEIPSDGIAYLRGEIVGVSNLEEINFAGGEMTFAYLKDSYAFYKGK
ncbi:MAG: hypothetical protein NT033_07430, partial [Candidatus Omnitrophica bacterium]|nr:hypothetical protein [Candidatus Omnitrophota bacterium]